MNLMTTHRLNTARLSAYGVIIVIVVLTFDVAQTMAAPQPGGGSPPVYQQRLVEQFDADENGRVEGPERVAALEWIREEREKNPPRRRGSGSVEGNGLEPRTINKDEVDIYPDAGLYDLDVIQTIFLDFDEPNWMEEMELLWRTDISTRATLTLDGVEYPDVGIHFRGSSSFFTVLGRPKKSFGISMDWGGRDDRLKGYKSLNLLSGHADPTFMRSVLFSHIANDYVPTPKTCFVQLVINGESWGLYINDQQLNKDFLEEAFDTRDGARWKVPPNFQGQSALAYQGPDVEDYESRYELRAADSDSEAWDRLIQLCDTLSNSSPDELPSKLPELLDIDHTLWFLAVDNVLMDGDGYHYRGSDYALYLHPDGRFYPLFRDNNESFSYSGGPGGFGREDAFARRGGTAELDPLALVDEERAALCHALLAVPAWREQYLENCRTIVDDWMDWEKVGAMVEDWQERIEPIIELDDKALYGHEAFLEGLDLGSERRPGLRSFFTNRRAYLEECESLK